MPPLNNILKNITKTWNLHSDKKVWTSTYWPMANMFAVKGGNPEENLWADGGCLDKFDRVLKKRGEVSGAKAFEKVPALNWVTGSGRSDGFYVANKTIREDDVELTTGVRLRGTGKLTKNKKLDFLDEFNNFGEDGATTGAMDVGWWGSCDAVALAGMLFEAPKRPVTIEGVTFTPNDIKGLLVVIADSQAGHDQTVGYRYHGSPDSVRLRDGEVLKGTITNMIIDDFREGDFRRSRKDDFITRKNLSEDVTLESADGTTQTIPASEIFSVTREDDESLSPALFHKTVKAWLRQNRPFAMDYDPGSHVWNDNFDGAVIDKSNEIPDDIEVEFLNGHEGPYSGGRLAFYSCKVLKGDKQEREFGYWIEKKDGREVNSGWIFDGEYDGNPDFLWRTANKSDSGFVEIKNERNPFVLPTLVEEIYKKSIA